MARIIIAFIFLAKYGILVEKCNVRVAGFLLAWHNAEEDGGWNPTDLWNVDPPIADDS